MTISTSSSLNRRHTRAASREARHVEYGGMLAVVWEEDLTERIALCNVTTKGSQYDQSPRAHRFILQTADPRELPHVKVGAWNTLERWPYGEKTSLRELLCAM
jgi:hypothetical protein